MGFAGKVVLITGAAGGLGRLAARRLAAAGARLVLGDVDAAGLEETALMVGEAVRLRVCDVAREADVAGLMAAALDGFGRLDVAINGAGILHGWARLGDLAVADFDRVMATNARGVFLCLKHQLPVMAEQGGGIVVNIASAAGLVGAPLISAYAASKHAVIGLTRSAADEYARFGIRINALCPSFAATPMLDAACGQLGTDRGEAEARLTRRIPMRRVARPEEVVAALLFLASEENGFMTGQAIAIDGGLTAV